LRAFYIRGPAVHVRPCSSRICGWDRRTDRRTEIALRGNTPDSADVNAQPQQQFRALVHWEGWEDQPFVIKRVTAADPEEARQLVSTEMMRRYRHLRGEPVRIEVDQA
jgi:hypothetical protein